MYDILHYLKLYGVAALDILIVASIIYYVYFTLVGTRAMPIVKGLLLLGIAYFLGRLFDLNTFLWLFEKGLEVAAIGLVVIFQDELRRIVMKLGEHLSIHVATQQPENTNTVSVLTQAVYDLSGKALGALIVLVRNTGVRGIIEPAVQIDALLTQQLLESIFISTSPIHDGAVVIHRERIVSAGCLLPLTERTDLNRLFGTRHRAALGLTELTDAVVIVVSEENRNVSLAYEGKLYYDVPQDRFADTLHAMMKTKDPVPEEKQGVVVKMKQKWEQFTRWFT